MKKKLFIFLVLFAVLFYANAQQADSADFLWGNGFYYNLNVGESITFNQVEVKLLKIENHFNKVKIGEDTLWLKVARRTVPEQLGGVRIFVADNKKVKALSSDSPVHSLLTKDALICLSDSRIPLLDPSQYIFPVSFNDGFVWSADEESYMFSFYNTDETSKQPVYSNFAGIGFDLHNARGMMKHWLVALENSRVVWVESKGLDEAGNQACVLLESESQPGIYYYYSRLYAKNLAVKKGQNLVRGDAIGTAWGDNTWGHFQFTVVKSQTEPTLEECRHYAINGFPQVFGLYFQHNGYAARSFSRGRIQFGKPRHANNNQKNSMAFEPYSGKGWLLGKWNVADRVEWVSGRNDGNVRLKKVLFEGTPAQCKNPKNYFEYQITAPNGTYRIRAKVGDLFLPSWQKLEFEGIASPAKSLDAGETYWTGERVVKINDGTLNIRIYMDEEENRVAGLSEIVFQRAY
ncbi:hypothetical protein [Mariniphaga sp.]|uniref:hypothetical protein n=1 Tax=Mariniphaga sp. TaxID=1954475 RepID=UPI0035690990